MFDEEISLHIVSFHFYFLSYGTSELLFWLLVVSSLVRYELEEPIR